MQHILFILAVLPFTVAASVFGEHVNLGVQVAEAPEPTAPPEAWVVNKRLDPRAVGSNTCGWINGVSTNSITCDESSAQCAHNSLSAVFGCCTGALSNCVLPTVCFDSTLAQALSVRANDLTLACISSASPYCQTFVKGFEYALGCGKSLAIFLVSSSLAGGSVVGGGASINNAAASASGGGALTVGAFNGGGASAASGVSAGGAAATSAAGAAAGAQTSGSNSGGTSGGGPSLSNGAIIAIAVCCAVVGVALLGLIGWSIYRCKRPNKKGTPPVEQVPGPGQPPQEPQQAGQGVLAQAGNTSSQPMTQNNMNTMLAAQPGEWDFAKHGVPQQQTAANDGIKVTEIMPEDAIDEQRRPDMMSTVGSNAGQTAIAPTQISHHFQGV